MRLPFAQGQVANVVQGFGNPTVSHNGYAAFCYDFEFPNSDINGYVFEASSPGTVAHVWEGGPNTNQGPSNFVTIEQGGGEFQIYDAPYAQYRARYDVLWQQGWRLKLFDRFTV